uniref:Uncharacterized protein n=1 Tax=Anguilla anguilla TaxID=7936 RepID=A0A0E9R0M9_ANGAN
MSSPFLSPHFGKRYNSTMNTSHLKVLFGHSLQWFSVV